MASVLERRSIGVPDRNDRNRGVLTVRGSVFPRVLEVYDGSNVDKNNGHIVVVKLVGEGASVYGMKEPVILYQSSKST